MLQGWVVIAVALAYIGLLFLVASYGDRVRSFGRAGRARLLIYPLSLAIYCTSWTFFGSVGLASRTGFDFLTIYIGPVLMLGLFSPLIIRIVRLAKDQNITSIADFIAARYGKSQAVAATVAMIAIVGTIPYIALQLKAVSSSLETILAQASPAALAPAAARRHRAVRRHVDGGVRGAVRHAPHRRHRAPGRPDAGDRDRIDRQAGGVSRGRRLRHLRDVRRAARLFAKALAQPRTAAPADAAPPLDGVGAHDAAVVVRRSSCCRASSMSPCGEQQRSRDPPRRLDVSALPRADQPVRGPDRDRRPADVSRPARVDSDMFVLALPLKADSELFALVAFVGGLSAATAMVIVESVALAIMVSNDIVMPWRSSAGAARRPTERCRRRSPHHAPHRHLRHPAARLCLLPLGRRRRSSPPSACSSFAAIAQLAPAFFGGLIWRRGTARGAFAGMTGGILVWAYTLLLPSVSDAGMIARASSPTGRSASPVAAAGAVRPRSAAAGARRAAQPRRQSRALYRRCRSRGARPRSSACRPTCSCRRRSRRSRRVSGCGAPR